MSQAAKSMPEPTMEEILSSIRRIIAEDDADVHAPSRHEADGEEDDGDLSSALDAQGAEPDFEDPPGTGYELDGQDGILGNTAYEEGDSLAGESADPFAFAKIPEDGDSRDRAESDTANDNGLIAREVDKAVSAAFQDLTHALNKEGSRTLEDLVSEMMRPMLRAWLNDNLASIVERLVREEIERISRRAA